MLDANAERARKSAAQTLIHAGLLEEESEALVTQWVNTGEPLKRSRLLYWHYVKEQAMTMRLWALLLCRMSLAAVLRPSQSGKRSCPPTSGQTISLRC